MQTRQEPKMSSDTKFNDHIPGGSVEDTYRDPRLCSCNCIGQVVRVNRSVRQRRFGMITRFDQISRKHSILFEDGAVEVIDMSKQSWELVKSKSC